MTEINAVTTLTREGDVAIITLNSPPVNALSANVRDGLYEGFKAAGRTRRSCVCEGRPSSPAPTSANSVPPRIPTRRGFDVQDRLSRQSGDRLSTATPWRGLEVALGALPVALPSAKVALPEVALGFAGSGAPISSAQRRRRPPRMVTSGRHVRPDASMGLVDEMAEEASCARAAIAFATRPWPRTAAWKVRDNNAKLDAAKGKPEIFADFRKANARKFRGFDAPEANIKCIEAAVNSSSFEEGLQAERTLFGGLMSGAQSAAQRYYFFAERQANKIPDVPPHPDRRSRGRIIGAAPGAAASRGLRQRGIPW